MIGNDIIDLQLESVVPAARQHRRLQRISSPMDRQLLRHLAHPFALCWSIKEACFKLEYRCGNVARFRIKSYQLDTITKVTDGWKGCVSGPSASYPFVISKADSYLHALVWKQDVPAPKMVILRLPSGHSDTQSAELRRWVERSTQFEQGTQIRKDKRGIPWLHNPGLREIMPVSLSHHGSWGAACWLNLANLA